MIKNIINTSLKYLTKLGVSSKPQELLEFVRQGKISESLEMIKSGVDVKAVTSNGTTALMISSANGQNDIVDAILSSPTVDFKYLNLKDDSGDSAIHYAAAFRNLNLLKKLVMRGVDINRRNDNGKTPLLMACESQNATTDTLDFIKEMIALKADVHIEDNQLNNPLIRAAINNDAELVDYLLTQGANPRVKNSMGYSAFRYSLENANKDMAISLILSLNNAQEIEENYAQSLKESTAYTDIKPTLEILKNKANLEQAMPEKLDKKEKSLKI